MRIRRYRRWSLAWQLFALQSLLLAVVVTVVAVGAIAVSNRRADDEARTRVLGLAGAVAANPAVAAAVRDPATASAQLQPYAERVRRGTGVDFVVIMSTGRVRFTHPDTTLIGKRFVGSIAPALAGREFTETYAGSLGPSVRAVAPVRSDGRVVGLVSVGITTEAIRDRLARQLPYLVAGLVALLAVALAGAGLVGRRLRRQTGGVDAATMSGMLATHTAVLESVHDGLVVTDDDGRVTLLNAEAARLLGLSGDHAGRRVADLPLPDSLRAVLTDPAPVRGELHLTGERVLVVDRAPALWREQRLGTVTTLRDRTELESLTGELDASKSLAEALRSQAHESANRIHTMVVLMETGRGEDAVRYGTEQLEVSQRLTDRTVAAVDEPVVAALLLGKVAQGAERGITVAVDVDLRGDPTGDPTGGPTGAPSLLDRFSTTDLTTVVGNLVDNALDASAARQRPGEGAVAVRLAAEGDVLVVEVSDDGDGLPPETVEQAFRRGWSTKLSTTDAGRGLGLALVNQVVRRHGGEITVGAADAGGARLTVRLPVPR